MEKVIIDVREKDEFDSVNIPDSIHIPLSQFESQTARILKNFSGKPILLMCRSGRRAELACKRALQFEPDFKIEVFPGGILEWQKQGKPIEHNHKQVLPLMRQVQLVAGLLIVVSVLLSFWVNFNFIWFTAFVGAGLTVAGLTGFCGMALLLNKMPWNRSNPKALEEVTVCLKP